MLCVQEVAWFWQSKGPKETADEVTNKASKAAGGVLGEVKESVGQGSKGLQKAVTSPGDAGIPQTVSNM